MHANRLSCVECYAGTPSTTHAKSDYNAELKDRFVNGPLDSSCPHIYATYVAVLSGQRSLC